METNVKRCSTCKNEKSLAEFPKDKRTPLGVKSECKTCHKERNLRLYYANRERYNAVSSERKRNNPEIRRAEDHRKRTLERNLTVSWTRKDIESVKALFDGKCPLTGSTDIHYDHFIPLGIGHGGTYVGNMIPLDAHLNESKQAKNPFEWIKTRDDVSMDVFNNVVDYLADINGMTSEEYRAFVYWCFDNKRNVDEVKRDGRKSVDIWKEAI
jgi:hypothetical protein